MSVERVWLVGLVEEELDSGLPAESFEAALTAIKDRVSGPLAACASPSGEGAVRFLQACAKLKIETHLALPTERRLLEPNVPAPLKEAWNQVLDAARSIRVYPSSGNANAAAWRDSIRHLAEICDVLLLVKDRRDQPEEASKAPPSASDPNDSAQDPKPEPSAPQPKETGTEDKSPSDPAPSDALKKEPSPEQEAAKTAPETKPEKPAATADTAPKPSRTSSSNQIDLDKLEEMTRERPSMNAAIERTKRVEAWRHGAIQGRSMLDSEEILSEAKSSRVSKTDSGVVSNLGAGTKTAAPQPKVSISGLNLPMVWVEAKRPRALHWEGFPEKGSASLKPGREFQHLSRPARHKDEGGPAVEALSRVATHRAGRWRSATQTLKTAAIVLNLTPALGVALTLLLAISMDQPFIALTRALLALLALAAVLLFAAMKTEAHWTRWRDVLEASKSLSASAEVLNPLFHPAARELPELATLVRTLTLNVYKGPQSGEKALFETRGGYVRLRVTAEMDHCRNRAEAMRRKAKWTNWIVLTGTAAGAFCAGLGLLGGLGHASWLEADHWLGHLIGFGVVVFPTIAAGTLALASVFGFSRRQRYFSAMETRLRHLQERLQAISTWPALETLMAETESLLISKATGKAAES